MRTYYDKIGGILLNLLISGRILISCTEKGNCKSIIKQAKKFPNVVDISPPRDKNDIDLIITLSGTEDSIKQLKNILYKNPDVQSIECSIY